MRLARLIGPDLLTLVREAPDQLNELLDEIHPEDICDVIAEFDDEAAATLITLLPADYAAEVLARIPEDRQEQLAFMMGAGSVARIATLHGRGRPRRLLRHLCPPSVGEPAFEELERVDPQARRRRRGAAALAREGRRRPDDDRLRLRSARTRASTRPSTRFAKNANKAEALEAVYHPRRDQPPARLHQAARSPGVAPRRASARRDARERDLPYLPELDQEEVARVIA